MVAQHVKLPRLQQLYKRHRRCTKVRDEFSIRQSAPGAPAREGRCERAAIGRFLENQKLKPEIRDTVLSTLTTISGQKPVLVRAKISVANFKVREGAPSGFMVTMRRDRMWHFLDRLISLAIPRIKDFRGVKDTSFDAAGTYSLGLNEQAVWPEINMAQVNFTHGMNINMVFEQSNPEQSRFALRELGMPFVRKDNEN